MNSKLKNKIKGFGLVEILVSLVIYGIAVIGVTALSASSYRIVKDNELGDLANSIMVRGIEYFKSASSVANLPTSGKKTFRVNTSTPNELGNPAGSFVVVEDTTGGLNKITTCSDTSSFRVTIFNNSQVLMCNQIIVTRTATNDFLLESVVVYQLSKRIEQSELIGFRPRIE